MNKEYAIILVSLAILTLGGCEASEPQTAGSGNATDAPAATTDTAEEMLWRTASLTPVGSDNSVSVSNLSKPLLIESFAVWCPTCTRQQQEIQSLHEDNKSISSLSVNVDPNEGASAVRDHVERNGFTWPYTVLPRDVTDSFVDRFGPSFVNPPSVPVVLVCPDDDATLLRSGVKTADELQDIVAATCD